MKETYLHTTLTLLAIKAESFPAGAQQAHQKLHALLPTHEGRSFYGLSHSDTQGNIHYWAAATQLQSGEDQHLECETLQLNQGVYAYENLLDIKDFGFTLSASFERLLAHPQLDAQGYCLEEYASGKDIRTLVPILSPKNQLDTKQLTSDIKHTFNGFAELLQAFNDNMINEKVHLSEWSPAQVMDHIIKAVGSLPDEQTIPALRFADEKVPLISKLFLNFDIKMQSPDFILPSNDPLEKDVLLDRIHEVKANLIASCKHQDLSLVCTSFELPSFGFLTRYEWLRFFLVHTQRHHHQLKKLYAQFSTTSNL